MSALAIRIIGGVLGGAIGTFISDKIYHFIYRPVKKLEQQSPPKQFDTKFQDVKSFEEIVTIELHEQQNNTPSRDEEHEHITIDTDVYIDIENENESENLFINDAIYDNTYIDYYTLYFGNEKEN
jgi:hypothetical protein